MIVTAQPIRHCERSFDFAQDKTSRSNLGRALRLRLALRPFGERFTIPNQILA